MTPVIAVAALVIAVAALLCGHQGEEGRATALALYRVVLRRTRQDPS